jgi:hypothetical protein
MSQIVDNVLACGSEVLHAVLSKLARG